MLLMRFSYCCFYCLLPRCLFSPQQCLTVIQIRMIAIFLFFSSFSFLFITIYVWPIDLYYNMVKSWKKSLYWKISVCYYPYFQIGSVIQLSAPWMGSSDIKVASRLKKVHKNSQLFPEPAHWLGGLDFPGHSCASADTWMIQGLEILANLLQTDDIIRAYESKTTGLQLQTWPSDSLIFSLNWTFMMSLRLEVRGKLSLMQRIFLHLVQRGNTFIQ